ncbi:hypothetical protein CSUI_003377 [Cystoisospora suis]|uniref:Uncharacterized protein n=1 Tax=Cystoisospora suis TaxID=483139 RepID=A0A2C6L582_9APIC|nr:hypothetical protein CSUI_003377 [Cystoisospora suis]
MSGRSKRDAPAVCSSQSSSTPEAGGGSPLRRVSGARVVHEGADGERDENLLQAEKAVCQTVVTHGASLTPDRQPSGDFDKSLPASPSRSASLSGGARPVEGADAGLALPPVGEFHDVATAAGHMWAGSNGGADCCKREHPDGSSERPISHHPGPPDFEVSASETEVKRFPSQVCPRDPVSRSQILDCSGERTPRIKREREWLFGATGDARRGEGGGRAPGTGSSEPDPKRGRVSGEEYEDTKRSGEVGRVFSESQAASFSTVPRTDSPEDLGSPSAPHQCSFSTQKRALTQAGPRDAMPCTHPCSQVTHGLREDNSAVGHSLHQACHQRCSQDAGVSGETREMSPVLRVPQLSGRGCIPGPAPNVLCLENQGETHQRYGAAILATTTAEPVSACPQANAEAMFPRGDKSPESPSTVRNHSQLLCSGRGRADSSPAIVTNGLRCRGSQPSAQLCLEGNVDSSGNAREATGEVSRRLLRGCETQRSCADLGDLLQLSPTSQAQNETGAHVRPAKASGPHHLLQECPRGVRDEGSRASGHPGDELTDAASLLRIKDEGACRGVSSTESQAIQPDWNRMTRGDANGRCGEVGRDHPYWANEAHERATGGTTVATNDRGSQTSHSLASRGQHCGRELFRKQPLHISQSPASLDSHGSDSPAKCDLVQTRGARHLEPRAAAVVHEIRANAGLTSWTGQSPVCSPRHSEIATHGGRGLFPEEVPLRRSSSAEVGTPANAEARSVTPVASCAALQRTRSLEQSPFKCSVSLSVAPESLSGVREAEAHNPWTKSEWPGFDVSRTDGDGPGRPTEEVPVRVPDQDAPHRAEGGGGHGCTRACDEQAGSMEFKTSLGPMCASHRHALQMHQPSRISRFLASETPGVPSPTTPASASLTEPVVGPPAAVPSVHVPSLNVKEELQTASDLHCGTPYDSSEYAVTKNSSSIQSESEQRGAPEWTADLIVGGRGPVHVLETPDSPEVQIPYPHDHVLGRFPTGGGSGDGERFSQVDVCSSSDSQRGSYCLSSAAAEHRESVAGSDTICYRPPTDRHGLAYVSGAHGCPATEKLTATGGATLDSALRLPSLIDNPNGSSSRASQQCTTLKGTEVPVWCPSQPGGTALTLPLDTGTRLGSTVYARGDSGQRREASDLNLCEERDNLRLDQQRSHPDKPLPPLHNQAQRVNPPLDVQRVCPSDDLESGNGETGTESRDCFTQASLALSAAAVECRRSSEIITDSGLVARTGRPDCESLYMQSGSAVSASCSRSESSRPEQEQQLGGLEASRAQGESAARSGLSLAQPSFVHPEQAFRQKAPVYHCFNAQMKETKPTDSLARSGSSSIQGRSLFWALSSHVLAQGEAFPSASVRCLLPCFSVTGFESLGSAFQLLLVDEDSHSQRKWGKQETFNLQGAIRDEVGCKVDKNDYNIPSPDVQCKRCHHADSGAL